MIRVVIGRLLWWFIWGAAVRDLGLDRRCAALRVSPDDAVAAKAELTRLGEAGEAEFRRREREA